MIPIQLQTQHPPVLAPHVASRNTGEKKHRLSKIRHFPIFLFHFQIRSENYTGSRLRIELRADRLHRPRVRKQKKTWRGKKKKHPLELYGVMQSVTIDQRVGGQDRSRQNTEGRRERKKRSEGKVKERYRGKGQRERGERKKTIKEEHGGLKTEQTPRNINMQTRKDRSSDLLGL